jgi:Domain of unknown function (DUF1844)
MTDEKPGPGFTLKEGGGEPPPRIDFATFVLSLAASALYHMGLAPDPSGGPPAEPDLPLARQTIDTLEMIEEKTRGNLDEHETQLIESVLYDLRMGFLRVEKT